MMGNGSTQYYKNLFFLIVAVVALLLTLFTVGPKAFRFTTKAPSPLPAVKIFAKWTRDSPLGNSEVTPRWQYRDLQPKPTNDSSNKPKRRALIRRFQGHGYVMAWSYTDQLTAGSVNLLSLQCWVKSLGTVQVVEPFLKGSQWGIDNKRLVVTDLKSEPRLYDVFDVKKWQVFSSTKKLAGIVKWEEFLARAPPNLILVGFGCNSVPDASLQNATTKFARKYHFNLVRKVCHNESFVFTPGRFLSEIYGTRKPENSVVLFHRWPGISSSVVRPPHLYRVAIAGISRCERNSGLKKFMDWIPLSAQIASNGKEYIKKYLSSSAGYIAVMFRIEQMFLKHSLRTHSDRIREGKKCIWSIVGVVQKYKKRYPNMGVFLAMDSGKYGSEVFRNQNSSDAMTLSHILFDRLYSQDSLTYKNWESSFENVTDFSTPGYVAMLQLNIAMNARVLVLAGGGSFQSIADRDVMLHHPGKKVYHLTHC